MHDDRKSQSEQMISPPADLFKTAMRRFASSVSIVTANDGSQPAGMTASSVTADHLGDYQSKG